MCSGAAASLTASPSGGVFWGVFLPLPAAAPSLCSRLGPVSQLQSMVAPIFQFSSSESVKEEGAAKRARSVTRRLQGERRERGELDLHHARLTLHLAVSNVTLKRKGCVFRSHLEPF